MRTVHTQPMNDTMTAFRLSRLTLAVGLALPATLALAQQQPDAGQTLQQTQPPTLQAPRPATGIVIQPPATAETLPGGQKVTLSGVRLTGHTVFAEAELLALLGEVKGQSLDLAGLRDLAGKIGQHYRDNGYPFARAFVPAQNFTDGVLTIQIVEGRYGKVVAQGDRAEPAQDFLGALKTGEVIESAALERATLILDDQPGIKSAPIIRPGQELGTGDLDVRVTRTPGFSGDVGYDNHGNRYTGEHRLRANLQFDSPFTFGDQLIVRGIASDEGMWLGNLGYSLPLGSSGLRGNLGYAHTYYELAKNFANLGATGTAKVTTLGMTYPVIRSQQVNLNLAATYQHKALNDKQQVAGTDDNKSSDSLPITLSFDRRDSLWGGGISYGSLAYTAGRLKLGSALETTDRISGQNTRGSFDKWNLDIARVQATPVQNLVFFGRVSAQWAGKNLDSSEGFSLGGANGVRAYPSGEGNGDEGYLLQLEARYTVGAYSPYVFYDSGRATINANNAVSAPANPNHRSIASSGLGVRYSEGPWRVDASLAWRSRGGQPESDTADRNPRLWVAAAHWF